ncbi:MAG: Uncharacterized protein G01um101416_266 [Microgenomates group bacterium Gr01-1014_16]|nr:MAG: Uncharacterized protein G01um101416_266 [Microgenomates group bacterium Gr01-1014_16]
MLEKFGHWFLVLAILLGFGIWSLSFASPLARAACWCTTPNATTPCGCGYSRPPGGQFDEDALKAKYSSGTYIPGLDYVDPEFFDGAYHSASLWGVQLECNTAKEANNFYANRSPICLGLGPEQVPYCACRLDPNGSIDCSQVTCYGTGAYVNNVNLPRNIPDATAGLIEWKQDVDFNGFHATNVKDLLVCSSSDFCCNRGDPDPPGSKRIFQCAGDTNPQFPGYDNYTHICQPERNDLVSKLNPQCGNDETGGESRLFFPHLKSTSFLATLLQSMFIPHPSSLIRNLLPTKNLADYLNKTVTNPNIDTSKVYEHQGIDDQTRVVNTSDNNSSVIVNRDVQPPYPAPRSPYNSYVCSLTPVQSNNPGDDLLGPKIRASLTFTQKFTYSYLGKRPGCKEDGAETTDLKLCCSVDPATPTPGGPTPTPGTSSGCECQIPFQSCPPDKPSEIPNPICTDTGRACCPATTPGGPTLVCPPIPPPGHPKLPSTGTLNVAVKTPLVEYISDTVLTGTQALINRFFPQGWTKTIQELPVPVTYSASSGTVPLKVGDGSTSIPTFYIPRIGALYQHFLGSGCNSYNLQRLLRPLGLMGTCPPPGSVYIPPPTTQCTEFSVPLVTQAIQLAAARYNVPVSLLTAVFEIESFPYITGAIPYVCQNNPALAAGPMQITRPTYELVTCAGEEYPNDIGICTSVAGKLSRCSIADNVELAARVLLSKVGLWNYTTCQPTGTISPTAKRTIYDAVNRYYGLCAPDSFTRNYSYILPGPKRTLGDNYGDIILNKMGFINSQSDYIIPQCP